MVKDLSFSTRRTYTLEDIQTIRKKYIAREDTKRNLFGVI